MKKPKEEPVEKPRKRKDDSDPQRTQRRIDRLLAKRAKLEGDVHEINRRLTDLGYHS